LNRPESNIPKIRLETLPLVVGQLPWLLVLLSGQYPQGREYDDDDGQLDDISLTSICNCRVVSPRSGMAKTQLEEAIKGCYDFVSTGATVPG